MLAQCTRSMQPSILIERLLFAIGVSLLTGSVIQSVSMQQPLPCPQRAPTHTGAVLSAMPIFDLYQHHHLISTGTPPTALPRARAWPLTVPSQNPRYKASTAFDAAAEPVHRSRLSRCDPLLRPPKVYYFAGGCTPAAAVAAVGR